MQSSGLPRTIDLSREFKSDRGGVSSTDLWTTLKVVEFADRTLLFVMNLKRVGHIMQINFPQLHQTLGANFPGRPPECYDLKTVLGPDTVRKHGFLYSQSFEEIRGQMKNQCLFNL